MARITVAVRGATDQGLRRSQNEDSHAVWASEDPGERERRGVLLVVADGMGGSRAGEVASRLTVETVVERYRTGAGADPLLELREAVEAANREVHDHSRSDPSLRDMGTTCTAAVMKGSDLYLAHVGDSRAYLVRHHRIRQLTRDHSLVAELVQRQQLTPEEARVDSRRNVVTRSIGVQPEVQVDAFQLEETIVPGDTLVLCSDGLHGQVDDAELAESVDGAPLEEASRELIALANERGGPDNITVVLARAESLEDTGDGLPRVGPRRMTAETGARSTRATLAWLIVALVALIVTILTIVFVTTRLGREIGKVGAHRRDAGEVARS